MYRVLGLNWNDELNTPTNKKKTHAYTDVEENATAVFELLKTIYPFVQMDTYVDGEHKIIAKFGKEFPRVGMYGFVESSSGKEIV